MSTLKTTSRCTVSSIFQEHFKENFKEDFEEHFKKHSVGHFEEDLKYQFKGIWN